MLTRSMQAQDALPEKACKTVLVLGIGNSLMGDDGIGVHVAEKLQQEHLPEGIRILDGGTLSFTLLATVEDSSALIVIDAGELGAPPGTIRVFTGEAMDQFLRTGTRRSVHEVTLSDLVFIASLRGTLPERRALVCIQPASIGWDTRPSPLLLEKMPDVSSEVRKLALAWLQ